MGKISEGVWYGIAEVDNISFIDKLILERQSIVRFLTRFFPQAATLLVGHLGPLSHPSNLPLLEPHHRKHSRLHAILKQRKLFGHVDDVELESGAFGGIADAEEEPLVVAFGVDVVLQDEVVFVVLSLVRPE